MEAEQAGSDPVDSPPPSACRSRPWGSCSTSCRACNSCSRSPLKDTGAYANTDILFTSDNGLFHGEHRIPNGKVYLYALFKGPYTPYIYRGSFRP